ncbi:MAG TPA: LptA/OstA family protein, partial [Phenylobacterium sp.]|nr:LptA/OstA family protein [Phenylobacterium sp.]
MIKQSNMKHWAAAAFACALAAAAPAAAQLAQNSDAPVDITADELEVVNAQCLAVYKGAAEALQDTVRLRADVLKIFYKPGAPGGAAGRSGTGSNCGSLMDRMEAVGSVYYVTKDQRVHGDNALYDADSDTITITGDVVAVQGQNVLRGSKMVINASTGDTQIQSAGGGRGKPNRVRTVLYPKQQTAGQAAA